MDDFVAGFCATGGFAFGEEPGTPCPNSSHERFLRAADDLRIPSVFWTGHPYTGTVVGAPGFEPGTPCTPSKCATGLRYAPKIIQKSK